MSEPTIQQLQQAVRELDNRVKFMERIIYGVTEEERSFFRKRLRQMDILKESKTT